MTRAQFWILTCSTVLVGLLFIAEIFMGRQARKDEHNLMVLEKIAQEGNGYNTRWQQLAVRIYQLSQQDPALKEVLVRHQINIASKPPAGNPPRRPASEPPANQPSPTAPQTSAPESTAPELITPQAAPR